MRRNTIMDVNRQYFITSRRSGFFCLGQLVISSLPEDIPGKKNQLSVDMSMIDRPLLLFHYCKNSCTYAESQETLFRISGIFNAIALKKPLSPLTLTRKHWKFGYDNDLFAYRILLDKRYKIRISSLAPQEKTTESTFGYEYNYEIYADLVIHV